jgi:glycosyltransferase involved in cell wall biosynthesis
MRTLLVAPASPFVLDSGSAQRTALLHGALARLGHCDVLVLAPGTRTGAVQTGDPRIALHAQWKSLPLGAEGYSRHEALTRVVAGAVDLAAYDAVVGRYLTPISKLALPRGVPALVDLDDVCYRYDASCGWSGAALAARAKAWLKQSAVATALPRFDGFFFVSALDRERFAQFAGDVLPNIPYRTPTAPPVPSAGATVLFVGSLWYEPNREGVERFLARAWPQVLAARPDARLVLAGAAPAADRARWATHRQVCAPGFVKDLDAAYRDATLAIAPVWCGGGTNIKVLEAFAHGRACVTTRFCAQAFGAVFDPATDLAVADDDAGLAGAVVRLLDDADEREARAHAGAAIVATKLAREHFDAIVAATVQRAMRPAVAASA